MITPEQMDAVIRRIIESEKHIHVLEQELEERAARIEQLQVELALEKARTKRSVRSRPRSVNPHTRRNDDTATSTTF